MSACLNRRHFVLYFPFIANASYFYCCKVTVNPFTVPSFCSPLSVSQIFGLAADSRLPTSEICLVIQS
jgi:hypothetical protein